MPGAISATTTRPNPEAATTSALCPVPRPITSAEPGVGAVNDGKKPEQNLGRLVLSVFTLELTVGKQHTNGRSGGLPRRVLDDGRHAAGKVLVEKQQARGRPDGSLTKRDVQPRRQREKIPPGPEHNPDAAQRLAAARTGHPPAVARHLPARPCHGETGQNERPGQAPRRAARTERRQEPETRCERPRHTTDCVGRRETPDRPLGALARERREPEGQRIEHPEQRRGRPDQSEGETEPKQLRLAEARDACAPSQQNPGRCVPAREGQGESEARGEQDGPVEAARQRPIRTEPRNHPAADEKCGQHGGEHRAERERRAPEDGPHQVHPEHLQNEQNETREESERAQRSGRPAGGPRSAEPWSAPACQHECQRAEGAVERPARSALFVRPIDGKRAYGAAAAARAAPSRFHA